MRTMPSLWSILPDELSKLKHAYEVYLTGTSSIDSQKIKALEEKDTQILSIPPSFYMEGDIAVMQVEGVIFPKADIFTIIFGGSTLDVMTRDFKALVNNDAVKAIILDIDSPGGVVFGVQEFASMVFGARAIKPIFSVSSSMMTSAANWIGSAAEKVFITDNSVMTGSIGVVISHIDVSELERKLGIKTTEVTSGKFKRIASRFAPLTTEGRDDLQGQVDHVYAAFINDIAKFRGVGVDAVRNNMADGKLFIGTQAIDAGLVDGVMTIEKAIGSINETVRVRSVKAQLLPGHKALIQKFVTDGKTTGGQAAVVVLKAENEKKMALKEQEPEKDFETLVAEYMEEHKCRKGRAIMFVANSHPDVHKEYIANMSKQKRNEPGRENAERHNGNKPRFKTLVDDYQAEHKCTRIEAIRATVKSHAA